MLTRYKQLYNQLTHSEAFGKNGGFDGHKINKRTFTPHNLRALLFGANGAIAVYYTTNKLENYKVRYIDIHSSFMNTMGTVNPQNYQEAIKEDKGMIDALYFSKGLNFNYVEEIFFFTEGFENQEIFNKEYQALVRFANDNNISNSMKRLMGIYVVKDVISRAYQDVIRQEGKSVVEKLAKANIPIPVTVMKKYNPERTELGLLVNRGLNGEEYFMDTKYTPDIDEKEGEKEQYRLSRYFYKEEQRALAEKKKRDEEKAKNDKMGAIMPFVDELWNDVRPIYEELYRNAIENGCVGILVPSGVKMYNRTEKKLYTNNHQWLKSIAEAFFTYGGAGFTFNNTDKFKSLVVGDLKDFNYFAEFHALNVFGIKNVDNPADTTRNWDTMLPIIEKRFKGIVKQFFLNSKPEELKEVYGNIQRKLTNCIVIERFDRNTIISMKYKMQGINIGFNKYFSDNSFNILNRENCKVLNNYVSQNNVNTMFGVFDAKKFASEALFSYQAYEDLIKSGRKLGLENTVMGRNLDGTSNIYNLKGNDARLTGLFAGSGSGKGVMTLGLLSSIVANNVPFIYLDYKPDMAEMLWEIEKAFTSQGITRTDGKPCRILAIDAKADLNDCSPVRGHYFGENAPDYLSDVPTSVFAVLPYLKLMQLYYLLASIRKNTNNQSDFGGKMTYAIFDELQQNAIDNLANLVNTMNTTVNNAKKMKSDTYEKKFIYNNKLVDFIDKLANQTGTFVNTDGRVANSRALYIGQNADYKIWTENKITENLYLKTSTRFFGRNGGTGSYAPTNDGTIREFVNNQDTFGYWTSAIGAGKVDKVKDWKVFKAYSVLNENDYNMDDPSSSGRCTAGVLSNIKDEAVREHLMNDVFVMDDGNGGKVIRPEVGFLGLIKKLSGFSDNQLADALSEGYEVIWKVMCKYGMNNKYPDVETYLFDCSLESILTVDEIKSGRFMNVAEDDSAADNISIFGDEETTTQHSFTVDGEEINKNENPVFSNSPSPNTPTPLSNSQHSQNNSLDSGTPKNENPVFNQNIPQRPQRPNQPINTQNTSQNDRYTVSDKNYYRGKIDVQDNPFTKYTSGSNTDTLLTVKDMTRILMEDIRKNVCPDDMVTSFMIADSTLFINEVIYEPTFDNAFMQSLPQSLRMKVENGQMAEFFDLRQVYKYKNLEKFGLMDELLAQGRARKEMAIGFRKRWSVLFRKFKRLQLIQVGDIKYFRENPDSNAEDGLLEKFKNNPALTYAKGNGVGFMDKVWDSRPVRAITRGLGWTMGVQTVWFAASLMGPWGLLFGAIAAASVYNDTKKRNQMNNTNNQNQYK
ncbi:MAG: hypothetical protein IJE45_04690 [Bacilli bacterium]|nr:hypothetical protein [Bacilli bacterium]